MSVRQRLLDTPAGRVPDALRATVREFCEPIDVIRSAFVGLTETTWDGETPEIRLSVAFELAETAAATDEGDRELSLVVDRFYEAMPADVQAGGCNFLDGGGLDAWHARAQQVFAR